MSNLPTWIVEAAARLHEPKYPSQVEKRAADTVACLLRQFGVQSIADLPRFGGDACSSELAAQCREYYARKLAESRRV